MATRLGTVVKNGRSLTMVLSKICICISLSFACVHLAIWHNNHRKNRFCLDFVATLFYTGSMHLFSTHGLGFTKLIFCFTVMFLISCKKTAQPAVPAQTTPMRIVMAGPDIYADLVQAYQVEANLVGTVSAAANPTAVFVPKLGTALSPHIEAMLAQHPTHVLGISPVYKNSFPKEVHVFTGDHLLQHENDIIQLIRQVGVFLNKPDPTIENVVQTFKQRMQAAASLVLPPKRPPVALLFPSASGELYSVGTSSIEAHTIQQAGGQFVLAELQPGQPISLEALLQKNPTFIVTDKALVALLLGDPRLQHVQAIQQKKVLGVRVADFTSLHLPELLNNLKSMLCLQSCQ